MTSIRLMNLTPSDRQLHSQSHHEKTDLYRHCRGQLNNIRVLIWLNRSCRNGGEIISPTDTNSKKRILSAWETKSSQGRYQPIRGKYCKGGKLKLEIVELSNSPLSHSLSLLLALSSLFLLPSLIPSEVFISVWLSCN